MVEARDLRDNLNLGRYTSDGGLAAQARKMFEKGGRGRTRRRCRGSRGERAFIPRPASFLAEYLNIASARTSATSGYSEINLARLMSKRMEAPRRGYTDAGCSYSRTTIRRENKPEKGRKRYERSRPKPICRPPRIGCICIQYMCIDCSCGLYSIICL